jgi:predicted nucleic acid-binding protein
MDTGPLVAYLDGADRAHRKVAEKLDRFSGSLATTSAVITEAMHFVSPANLEGRVCWPSSSVRAGWRSSTSAARRSWRLRWI